MFLKDNKLTAFTSTVGSGVNPVYLNGGRIVASTRALGSGSRPIYMNGGTLEECSYDIPTFDVVWITADDNCEFSSAEVEVLQNTRMNFLMTFAITETADYPVLLRINTGNMDFPIVDYATYHSAENPYYTVTVNGTSQQVQHFVGIIVNGTVNRRGYDWLRSQRHSR